MTYLFEQVFCFRVIWIRIGVQFTGALAVGAFNFVGSCSAIYF
jgi:hypothetical protein